MGAVTLEQVRAGSSPALYPCVVLEGCETALVLFAAAFYGQQDAIWIAEAGMSATCVDLDAARLAEMSSMYPSDWEYVTGDVFDFAWAAQDRWSVVSIDCPSNLFDKCADWIDTWCRLARKAVILGTGVGTEVDPPPGWTITEVLPRSSFQGGVYWTVVERL
jgi:hypothetical protein